MAYLENYIEQGKENHQDKGQHTVGPLQGILQLQGGVQQQHLLCGRFYLRGRRGR